MNCLWSKSAAIGAGVYLLAFMCAAVYPWFDHRTFSGLAAVLLALPLIDYFPSSLLPLAVIINAVIIYAIIAIVSCALDLRRKART